MAFTVAVADDVVDFIRRCDGLTLSDQDRILLGLVQELGADADKFLMRNTHPIEPNLFWYDFLLMTESRVVREFRFWCSAEGRIYGVIEVQYGEEYLTGEEDGD
jgi:hypothetical protein